MPPVYAIASNITSALGLDTAAHWQAVSTGKTGIKRYEDKGFSNAPFMGSKLEADQWQIIHAQTYKSKPPSPFEQLASFSVKKAIDSLQGTIDTEQTAFILATTKGNIELIGRVPDEQLLLQRSAKIIAGECGVMHAPFTISQACVSGVVALQYGMRLIQSGRFKHVIVTGCDRFSRFVLNGFQSFQAISDGPCRPFDASRKGITLGEAAATIILSVNKTEGAAGQLISGATSNDANHISGPSRTGKELAMAINSAIARANITPEQVDMISAHGTATVYNDEMEARAFAIAGLLNNPVHSFKGHIGHTLGAAGVLESAMVLESMGHQMLLPTAGYKDHGVSKAINITTKLQPANIEYVLKTASGFGGCNAVIVWKKA